MAQDMEPMDVDCMDSEFDNKENTYHHSNMLPCTEKGYEELDVSELNMKLRYSITPAASPMSKSYTAHTDHTNFDTDELNCTMENNLSRSLNSTMIKHDSVIKSLKTLPLQSLPTDQLDSRNSSVLRPLDTTLADANNITVTINEGNEIDDNLSLPSTSSSMTHTPEATTPVNDGGSPIMRGLKSMLNIFRPSQSPIPPGEVDIGKPEASPSLDMSTSENLIAGASSPIAAQRKKDGISSKRSSPLKNRIVFNDDLEKELQWNDETTIFFSSEKIPIHKLFYHNAKPKSNIAGPSSKNTKVTDLQSLVDNMNTPVEYMDISNNDSAIIDRTLSKTPEEDQIEVVIATESDSEFVDCENTFTNNGSYVQDNENLEKDPLLEAEAPKIDVIEKSKNISKEEVIKLETELDLTQNNTENSQNPHKDVVTKPDPQIKADTNSTISIIQELDSLLEGNDSKKETTANENNMNTNAIEVNTDIGKIHNHNEKGMVQLGTDIINMTLEKATAVTTENSITGKKLKAIIVESTEIPKTNFTEGVMKTKHLSLEHKLEIAQITMEPETDTFKDSNQPELLEQRLENQSISVKDQGVTINEMAMKQTEKPAEVPLPDEDDIDTELSSNDPVNTTNIVQTSPDVIENIQTEAKLSVAEHLEKSFSFTSQANPSEIPLDSVNIPHNNQIQQETTGIQEEVLNTTQVTDTQVTSSVTDKGIEPVSNMEEIQCISTDTEPINESLSEENRLPDLVNQTMPIDNVSKLLENKDEHSSESIKDFIGEKASQEPLIQEPLNISVIESPIAQLDIPVSEINDLHPAINTIDEAKDVVNTTSNEADSTVTLHDQTMNTQNYITIDVIDDKITKQDNEVNATVIIDNATNKEIVNTTVSLENPNTVSSNISVAENKNDLGLENANLGTVIDKELCSNNTTNATVTMGNDTTIEITTSSDKYSPIRENKANSTAIIDGDKDTADATVIIEQTNNVVQENTQVDEEFQPNIESQLNVQNLDDIKEPQTDIEIIVSENNSPYVSVMAGIDTGPKLEDNIETLEFSRPDVPSSPPIVSKGYNFNFDDIQDPFATKIKIRQSPPSNTTPIKDIDGNLPKETELPKRVTMNRRKSQPPERKRPTMNKNKFNTTIDATTKTTNKTEREKEAIIAAVKDKRGENISVLKPNHSNEELAEENTDVKQGPTNVMKSEEKDIAIELEQKISCDSSSATEVKTTSSSEQSYFSAAGSSSESFISKNVFNIPEIDDSNLNPFATISRMRESPPLVLEENPFVTNSKMRSSPNSSTVIHEEIKNDVKDKMDVEMMEKDEPDTSAVSSSKSDEKNLTREVNTEDEDTEEGPFLEAEEVNAKTSILTNENIECNSLPTQSDNNLETGEVFIDAEAFEFFLNQNQSNMVADSGKESLFLKFDPLFAKRISSDGVVAALKNIQKSQSTPTKNRPFLRTEVSPIAGPSDLNTTFETDVNTSQESNDETNITVAKPTMIVSPAVNPVVTPRNKSITPNRSNRRSITFTSPAMAVIDRLISISANNSLADTSVTQPSRDQHEAEAALSQLRELLAEKEILVYNLRAESKLLKERLTTMESQVKIVEDEGQDRLKKINELNSWLIEKSEINKRMAEVVEEYERTIASLIAETEQDKKRHAEERTQLIKERDEQLAHLASMESSFSDLHSKYEKSKQVILSYKANEETYKKSLNDFDDSLTKMQNNYEMLKQHATSKLNHANQELEKMNKAHEAEVLKLNALLKRKELHVKSLEDSLALKTKANDELTAICDELINKVGTRLS